MVSGTKFNAIFQEDRVRTLQPSMPRRNALRTGRSGSQQLGKTATARMVTIGWRKFSRRITHCRSLKSSLTERFESNWLNTGGAAQLDLRSLDGMIMASNVAVDQEPRNKQHRRVLSSRNHAFLATFRHQSSSPTSSFLLFTFCFTVPYLSRSPSASNASLLTAGHGLQTSILSLGYMSSKKQ